MSALVLYVRFHDGRYHGEGDWPPSPARLFQALVAGAGLGSPLGDGTRSALEWLEKQEAPIIAVPRVWQPRRGVLVYVPNNDSDSVGGDPARMSKIRTATKLFRPYLFDAEIPFVYAWPLATDDQAARAVCFLAERLYQLGRGIDMAWAWGEILDHEALDALLTQHPGCVFRPSVGRSTLVLPAPLQGSLESVERRYRASGDRFRYVDGRTVKVVFRQPPRPRFRPVSYESPPARRVYELRQRTPESAFAPWPLVRASDLVVRLRDAAVARLENALPLHEADVARVLVGRRPDGTNNGPTEARVRIVPLPSIGHPQADRGIRRVLVEVPARCPLRADDVWWAFSGLPFDPITGGLLGAVLTPATDESMLRWYGIADEGAWRTWRSVTPVALPPARRPRADERARRQACAAAAVVQALRHAGLRSSPETVRVQREPFESKGVRAESFATRTRFTRDRLWHVEITFPEPIRGPLVIGDGRFLGLGVMRPVDRSPGIHAFVIEDGLIGSPNPVEVARALRRAVMARVQALLGQGVDLPAFFSAHERAGDPVRSERSSHLAFLFDPGTLGQPRLLIVAPHVLERRRPTRNEFQHLCDLDTALTGLQELRAGSAGRLRLRSESIDPEADPLFAPARIWASVTPYNVTRHTKHVGATEALALDLHAECQRRRLPKARVSTCEVHGVARVGLIGYARLTFKGAVNGPIVLGRSRYLGGGLFFGIPS
jgi:CRISPR-associated protein Csb2